MMGINVTSNNLILEADPILREQINLRYGVDFGRGGYGDRLLQSARITLFGVLDTVEEGVHELFDSAAKVERFFGMVDSEIKESGDDSLRFKTSLNDDSRGEGNMLSKVIEDVGKVESSRMFDYEEDRVFEDEMYNNLSPREIVIARAVGIGELARVSYGATLEDSICMVKKGARKIEKVMESEPNRKTVGLRKYYSAKIHRLCDDVISGRVKDWRGLSTRRVPFFSWLPNIQEVVKYTTTNYVLPHYGCKLEDIPIQRRLTDVIKRFNLYGIGSKVDATRNILTRDIFLMGFPDMIDSPHWNIARWGVSGINEEMRKENQEFIVDYVFRYKLGCRTRGDVINVLDEETELRKALRNEKPDIYGQRDGYGSMFNLIKDKKGEMYDIDPWELNHNIPKGTWLNDNGDVNMDNVRKYVSWVEKYHGIPNAKWGSYKSVPHFGGMYTKTGLSIEEIRSMIPNRKV
jgi:hypothetical protein